MSDDTSTELSPQPTDDGQLELWQEMVAVERERVEVRRRAADALHEGIKALAAADERQFQFATDRLHRDDQHRKRRFRHKTKITWTGVYGLIALVALVLAMAFWGNEDQRGSATALMVNVLSFGGGVCVGVVWSRRAPS